MIEVVSAVIIRNGRILLTQRRADKVYPFMWECPGGKVDGNESHHAALKRELREELGCEAHALAMNSLWCDKVTEEIFLLMYRVDITFQPQICEGQLGVGWFTADEMEGLTLTPGNKKALSVIAGHLRRCAAASAARA